MNRLQKVSAVATAFVVSPLSLILLNIAYNDRGYWAVGGEYILIGVFATLTYMMFERLIRWYIA